MGLPEIKKEFKYLSSKDAKEAERLVNNEDWESLLKLLEEIVEDANIDVVLASEEDNGQKVKEKSEILDKLINLKFKVEDYVDALEEDYDDGFYDDEIF